MKKIFLVSCFGIASFSAYADDVSAVITNAGYGEADGTITLEISAGVAPYTFVWTGPDGFVSSEQDISGLAPGEYCVVVNDFLCGVAELCVTVEEEPFVAIADHDAVHMAVYPNPFTAGIDISMTIIIAGNYTILLADQAGNIVWQQTNNLPAGEDKLHIDTGSLLPAGVYDLFCKDEKENVVVRRVVKVK